MNASAKGIALLTTTALACACLASGARAQTVAAAAGNETAAGPQGVGLQDIVVTAQRREERLQRTPLAITALSPKQLETRNIQTTQDLMQVTPSLQVSTQTAGNGSGSATFFIRGLGQQRSGNGTGPAVGIYVDDFYYPSLQGAVFSILDLQQVEVLRGPQGTLFGRNTIGGAIRYTTRKPEFDKVAGYVQGTFGSYDRADLSGSLNLPLGDNAAVRVTAGRLRTDGYVHQQNGGKDAGGTKTDLVRGEFRFDPVSTLEVQLAGQYNHNEVDGFPYFTPSPITPVPGTLPFIYNTTPAGIANPYDSHYASQCGYCQAGTNKREFSRTSYYSGNGTVIWHASDELSVKSLTGWQRVKSSYLKDLDASPAPINDSVSSAIDRAFSQEVQLNGNMLDRRFNWVLGGYYYDEKHSDLYPEAGAQTTLGRPTQPTLLTGITRTKAGFVDATFKLTDRFTILGGVRYSSDAKSAVVRTATGTQVANGAKTFNSTTWRIGAQYQLTEQAMAYATVSRGFRAGGFAKISGTSPIVDTFEPENATNYETGLRLELLDHRLRINPTLFYTKWDNIQVQRVVPGASGIQIFVENAARAHSQGFELESEAAITKNFHLTGTLSLLDIKYDEVGSTTTITLNSHFARAPKVTYSLGADYHVDLGGSLRVGASTNYSFQDKQYAVPSDIDQVLLVSYALLNARVELSSRTAGWTVALFVTNLTDKVYYIGGDNYARAGTGTAQYDLGRPREFGVNLRFAF